MSSGWSSDWCSLCSDRRWGENKKAREAVEVREAATVERVCEAAECRQAVARREAWSRGTRHWWKGY